MRVAMDVPKSLFIGLVVGLVALAGCDRPTSEFVVRFVEACGEGSNMPEAVCQCLARTAEEDLAPEARTFLLASLEEDDDAIDEARNQLGAAEAVEAGMFMTQAGACASELERSGASAP